MSLYRYFRYDVISLFRYDEVSLSRYFVITLFRYDEVSLSRYFVMTRFRYHVISLSRYHEGFVIMKTSRHYSGISSKTKPLDHEMSTLRPKVRNSFFSSKVGMP